MTDSQKRETIVAPNGAGRLDTFLTARFSQLSRSRIQNLIKEGEILVGGSRVKAGFELSGGEVITLSIPELKPFPSQKKTYR